MRFVRISKVHVGDQVQFGSGFDCIEVGGVREVTRYRETLPDGRTVRRSAVFRSAHKGFDRAYDAAPAAARAARMRQSKREAWRRPASSRAASKAAFSGNVGSPVTSNASWKPSRSRALSMA